MAEPIELFDVSIGAANKEVDPVCRMMLTPDSATASLRHEGATYYFCSSNCLQSFFGDPASYTTA